MALRFILKALLQLTNIGPLPHRGGWISSHFLVKYSPGFPGFLNKNPYFHTDFHKKKKKKKSLRYLTSTLVCFLTLEFQENFAK